MRGPPTVLACALCVLVAAGSPAPPERRQILEGFVEGFLSDQPDLKGCIGGAGTALGDVGEALRDILKRDLADMADGLRKLADALGAVPVAMKACKASESDVKHIVHVLEEFKGLKNFSMHVLGDVVMDFSDISTHLVASGIAYDAKNYEESGIKLGEAFHRVVAGKPKSVTPFPESIFGVWHPKAGVPLKAILGPLSTAFMGSFKALRDPATNDVWFTLLTGQMWHVIGNETQYCFGEEVLAEQSPFSVDSVHDDNVTLCWRRGLRGMPTHTTGCSGCDCAKILIQLTDPNTLHFQFWMSPPVIHADLMFTRTGPEPTMKNAIHSTMLFPYQQCALRDHYGPNLPGEPDLRNKTGSSSRIGCGSLAMKNTDLDLSEISRISEDKVNSNKGQCHQLNGLNFLGDAKLHPSKRLNVSDVKLQYKIPQLPCDPCDVSYSVSAKIQDDEYIALGFKGQSWEHMFPYPPENASRPCYFGMCVDSYDNFTSDRIALGYASRGGCVREMVSKNIIGKPSDVDYKLFSKTSVERNGDRTILRFTIAQHWPGAQGLRLPDGPFRTMWAIGKVSGGNGCAADIGYHGVARGVSPITWLLTLGSTPCNYSSYDMGDAQPDVMYA